MFKKHILLITVCFGSIFFGFENINCFNKINVKSKNKIDNISSDFIDDDIYIYDKGYFFWRRDLWKKIIY